MIRHRGSRGFRDMEGEAIYVAAKVADLVRRADLVEALRVVRRVQVRLVLGVYTVDKGDVQPNQSIEDFFEVGIGMKSIAPLVKYVLVK